MGHVTYTVLHYVRINSCDTQTQTNLQLESRVATLYSSQEGLLQVMSVNKINTVKSAHGPMISL